MIYFIRSGDWVKIGHTKKSARIRLKELQTGNPIELKLLGSVEGDHREECRLHDLFSPFRGFGEWFSFKGELESYILAITGKLHHIREELSNHKIKGLFRFKSVSPSDRLKVAYDIENDQLRRKWQQ